MSWSDAARAAALEARRRKSEARIMVMDSQSGIKLKYSRKDMADKMRSIRKQLRTGKNLKIKDTLRMKSQLRNFRHAAKWPVVVSTSSHSRPVGGGLWG